MSVVKSQERRVKSQKRTVALRMYSGSRLSTLSSRLSRRGITLIELLITMLIISILAGLILGVAAVAGETAREAHSRHMITRLHNLLMEHYDTYKTRRVRLRESDSGTNNGIEAQITAKFPNLARRGQVLAEARLYALREMMLMEIPDRWSDVLLANVGQPAEKPVYLVDRTDLSNVYLRRYNSLIGRTNAITGVANTPADIVANQSAECLYLVITLATGDGEARTLFGENSIGDVDGDGAPEFLDGWDHPISFLRWAPGFDSQIQINANQFDNPNDTAWTVAAAGDHDPFDMFRVDPLAFRLVPLVYSAGRDEELGLYDVSAADPLWLPPSNRSLKFSTNNRAPFIAAPRLTPYVKGVSPGPTEYLGTALSVVNPDLDNTSTDNIHNHLLGRR